MGINNIKIIENRPSIKQIVYPSIRTEIIDRPVYSITKTSIREKIEYLISSIKIDKSTYRVITVNIPFPFDFVILQNDYLPTKGEYFLN
jgi:hypothetical protein